MGGPVLAPDATLVVLRRGGKGRCHGKSRELGGERRGVCVYPIEREGDAGCPGKCSESAVGQCLTRFGECEKDFAGVFEVVFGRGGDVFCVEGDENVCDASPAVTVDGVCAQLNPACSFATGFFAELTDGTVQGRFVGLEVATRRGEGESGDCVFCLFEAEQVVFRSENGHDGIVGGVDPGPVVDLPSVGELNGVLFNIEEGGAFEEVTSRDGFPWFHEGSFRVFETGWQGEERCFGLRAGSALDRVRRVGEVIEVGHGGLRVLNDAYD